MLSLVAHRSGLTVAQAEVPQRRPGQDQRAQGRPPTPPGAGPGGPPDHRRCHVLPARPEPPGPRRRRPLPLGRQGESADAPGRHPGGPGPRKLTGLFPPRQRRIWLEAMDTATTLEKGHGRRERRTLTATTALNEYLDWPGVGQVGRIESVVERDGKCDRGDPLLHHQRAARGRRRRGAAAMVAGPLDDREPVALRARREHGRGCQPDPQGIRAGGDGGAAEPGHRLPTIDGGRVTSPRR